MIFGFDPAPKQDDYDENEIRTSLIGRRQLRTEWPTALYAPDDPTKNWRIILPFPNTFQNAFFSMCDIDAYPHTTASGRLCLFLNGTEGDAEPPTAARGWLDVVSDPVVMKDHLALSCALDYEREGGNPNCQQTAVGALRSQAKPYGGNAATERTKEAADELAEMCIVFLNSMNCYESADCIVAMPPSDPAKKYNPPRYLAECIEDGWGVGVGRISHGMSGL